jgi:hypothetical protein
MVQAPTRTNDATTEMMVVRIMTQLPFPGVSPDACRYCVCVISYRDIVLLGVAPIPKYKALAMSAFGGKADMAIALRNV